MSGRGFIFILGLISFLLGCESRIENNELVEYLKSENKLFFPSDSLLIDTSFIIKGEDLELRFNSITKSQYFNKIRNSKKPLRFQHDSVSFNDELISEYTWKQDTLILRSNGSRLWTHTDPDSNDKRFVYKVMGEIGAYYVIHAIEFEDHFLWLLNKNDGVVSHYFDFPAFALNTEKNWLLYADGLIHHYSDSTRLYMIEANSAKLDTLLATDINWSFYRPFFTSNDEIVFIFKRDDGYFTSADKRKYSYMLVEIVVNDKISF